jgi:hypothetical protein
VGVDVEAAAVGGTASAFGSGCGRVEIAISMRSVRASLGLMAARGRGVVGCLCVSASPMDVRAALASLAASAAASMAAASAGFASLRTPEPSGSVTGGGLLELSGKPGIRQVLCSAAPVSRVRDIGETGFGDGSAFGDGCAF